MRIIVLLLAVLVSEGYATRARNVLKKLVTTEKKQYDEKATQALYDAMKNDSVDQAEAAIEAGAYIGAKRQKDGMTPLQYAAWIDSPNIAAVIIKAEADVNEENKHRDPNVYEDYENYDPSGKRALHYAAESNSVEVAKLLIANGAEIDAKDQYGKTALHYAVDFDKSEMVIFLIESGANIEIRDKDGKTPLHYAIEENNERMVKLLIDKGAYTDSQDENGRTPLHYAAWRDRRRIAEIFFNKDIVNIRDDDGKTPLHIAAAENSTDMADFLIKNGASIDVRDKYGKTPLYEAAFKNSAEVGEMLLNSGAVIDAMDVQGKGPWNVAVSQDNKKIGCIFIKHGIDIGLDEKGKEFAQTLLFWAVENNDVEKLEMLLEKGAEVNARDSEGNSLWSVAARGNKKDVGYILIKYGVHIESSVENKKFLRELLLNAIQNKDKKNGELIIKEKVDPNLFAEAKDFIQELLFDAARRNDPETGRILARNEEVNVNAKDDYGWTALHWAARENSIDMAQVLVDNGADINARDKYDRTPLDVAEANNRREVMDILISRDRNVRPENPQGRSESGRAR